MMNLFTAFGLAEPEEEQLKEKAEAPKKKETPKKEVAKPKKEGTKPTQTSVMHQAHEIRTGFCTWRPDYEGGKTIAELSDLFQAEYPGAYTLCECGTASQVRVKIPALYRKNPVGDSLRLASGTLVCFGQHQLRVDEECEVSVALTRFAEMVPDFAGCKAYYDIKNNRLYPFHVVGDKEPEITFPCTIGYGDELLTIAETPNESDFSKVVQKAYEKEYQAKLSGIHYVEDVGHWVPVYDQLSTAKATAATAKQSETTKKYPIPVDVRCFMQTYTFGAESFPEGTTEVTAEQVRQALEKLYFEYSKERTKMEYDETHKCFIPILKTSVKGSGERVENHGFATFTLNEAGVLTEFEFHLPKIPGTVLDELVAEGKKSLPNEVMLQLFWDNENYRYIVFKPEQKACSTGVIIKRNSDLEQKYWLVADMHTHGNGRAFFSQVDNMDEKGWRIFLVCGNLGGNPEFRVRVGANGSFIDMLVGDLFEGA